MLKLLPRKNTVNLLLLFPIAFLSLMCLEMDSTGTCAGIFPDTEVRLTNVVPRIFLLAFHRDGCNFVLFLGVRKLHWSVFFVTYNGFF